MIKKLKNEVLQGLWDTAGVEDEDHLVLDEEEEVEDDSGSFLFIL